MISLLLLTCVLPWAFALTCLRTERNPLLPDCTELAEILREQSLRPMERNVKRWGRDEEDSPTSARLPKHYYIFKPSLERQSTCIVRMDAYEREGGVRYDDFKFSRVAASAININSVCIANGSPGLDFPGSNEVVFVKVARVAILPPWLLAAETIEESYNVTIGNMTAELRVSSGQEPVLRPDLPVTPQSS